MLATLQFTWIWNDFLWPLIFTQSDDKRTIMIGIVNLKGQYSRRLGRAGRTVARSQPAHAACLPLLPALFHQGHDHGRESKDNAMAQLNLSNLRKSFGAVQVIKGLDLTIEDGEFVVLLDHRAAASPPSCA